MPLIGVYANENTPEIHKQDLIPSSDARQVGGLVCAEDGQPFLYPTGFPARCGCPCSVHTVAACGEVHGLSAVQP